MGFPNVGRSGGPRSKKGQNCPGPHIAERVSRIALLFRPTGGIDVIVADIPRKENIMTTITQPTATASPATAKAIDESRTTKPAAHSKGVKANFTIDAENNITAHAGRPPADGSEPFGSLKDLTRLSAKWPISRLADVWNSFAGVAPFNDLKPVKKFTDRNTALTRIWKAIERLAPIVTQPARDVAPAKTKAKKQASQGKRRDTARLSAEAAKRGIPAAREGSKKAQVVDLMRRPSGATLAEIMELTSWQPHTVRGFVSGTLVKRMRLRVESFREEKMRSYRITA